MKAMILAAGFGKRMMPLSSILPKPLFPFANKPIIEYTFEFLKNNGITDIILNSHHLANILKDRLGDGTKYDINIKISHEPEILGTAGAIKAAEDFLRDETFIIINGDILFDFNLEKTMAFHKKTDAISTLLLREDENALRYGIIKIDQNGEVCRFLNNFNNNHEHLKPSMFTGIHILEPEIFDFIPSGRFCGITEEIYPELLSKRKLFGCMSDGYWNDLGHHNQYLMAHKDAIDGKYSLGQKTIIRNKSIIEKGCNIGKDAEVGPYAVVSNSCQIDNSIVRNSVLWENVVIKNSKVSNSIIGNNCVIKNMEISDSVVVNINGETTVYGLRFTVAG